MIIFDLDDTLVDTSGCITHYKLERALEAMVDEGLNLPDFHEGLLLLKRLNASALSAELALAEFIKILGVSSAFQKIGCRQIYETDLPNLPLLPLQGAIDLLAVLQVQHRLALVSIGFSSIQMQKLEKAGIDSSVFSKILVTQERNKKPLYQRVQCELAVSSRETVVCGDRIVRDLAPGRALGFTTVLMQWGRGLSAVLPDPDVDYAISSLNELKGIIDHRVLI